MLTDSFQPYSLSFNKAVLLHPLLSSGMNGVMYESTVYSALRRHPSAYNAYTHTNSCKLMVEWPFVMCVRRLRGFSIRSRYITGCFAGVHIINFVVVLYSSHGRPSLTTLPNQNVISHQLSLVRHSSYTRRARGTSETHFRSFCACSLSPLPTEKSRYLVVIKSYQLT